jgi:hypothetical protein
METEDRTLVLWDIRGKQSVAVFKSDAGTNMEYRISEDARMKVDGGHYGKAHRIHIVDMGTPNGKTVTEIECGHQ